MNIITQSSVCLLLLFASSSFAQIRIDASQFQDKRIENGAPESEWNYQTQQNTQLHFVLEPSHLFSCFGIGWKATDHQLPLALFHFKYRTLSVEGNWSEWKETEAEFGPADNPRLMYWSDATFTYDAQSHQSLELIVAVPNTVQEIKVKLFDGNFQGKTQTSPLEDPKSNPLNCPAFPNIIPRSQWCGGSATCTQVNTAYTPTYISPTHIVIHHGASPDTYTNGTSVVQSYYNYHVNTLGWTDIGYNFLVDKFGNFYQGRHNPNLSTSDVRGAHAGNANSGSIGINFPGNADVTIATPVQLEVVNRLMAWWFDRTGFDPTSSASMTTQAFGVQVKPRICGHKDVGQTSCPGTDLYGRIPTMRTRTKQIIDSCNACTAPVSIYSSNISTQSANIQWSSISNAQSYELAYKASNSLSWTQITVTGTSYQINSLIPNTMYNYKVRANCISGQSAYTRENSFSTLVVCDPVAQLSQSLISSNSALISWSTVVAALSYQYEYKTTAATNWTVGNTSNNSVSLAQLNASTSYQFRVLTICNGNNSVYSNVLTFTTLAPPCNIATGLSVSGIGSTTATLQWTTVSGAVSYTLRYRVVGTSTWINSSSTTNSKALTGLQAASNYEFQVQTNCASNTSTFSNSSTFTTAAPPDIQLTIGSGTQAYSGHPFATGFSDERTQYIFTSAELAAAGWSATNPYLKTLSIQVSTAASQAMNNFTITFSHTNSTVFSNSNFIAPSGATSTYSATATTIVGWNNFTLNTPFPYNGSQNLLVTICWNNSSYTSHSIVPTTILNSYRAIFTRANLASSNLCANTTGTLSYYRPNFKFTFRAINSLIGNESDPSIMLRLASHSVEENTDNQENSRAGEDQQVSIETEDLRQNGWTVYPNPFRSTVWIKQGEEETALGLIRIYNLLGLLVWEKESNQSQEELDLTSLEAGIYLIQLGTKGQQLIKMN